MIRNVDGDIARVTVAKKLGVMGPKGGVGKTTIAFLLAIEAVRDGARVALMDLDAGQASLSLLHHWRGSPDNPALIPLEGKLKGLVAQIERDGYDWLIMDGPPSDMDLMDAAIMASDAVLIPSGARLLDVAGVDAAVEIAQARRKPFAFVLNAVHKSHPVPLAKAEKVLRARGRLLAARLSFRQDYYMAPERGLTAAEVNPALLPEARTLWAEAKALAEGGR